MGCTDFIAVKTLTRSVPEIILEMTQGGVNFAFASVGDAKAMVISINNCLSYVQNMVFELYAMCKLGRCYNVN